jgi:hypothetical protein
MIAAVRAEGLSRAGRAFEHHPRRLTQHPGATPAATVEFVIPGPRPTTRTQPRQPSGKDLYDRMIGRWR